MKSDKDYDILIVDDQPDNVFLLKMLLNRQKNIVVHSVGNGLEAIEFISETKIDLVLMDIMMPVMDGNTATLKLREQYDSSELPIIMVTTLSDVENLVKSFENGANDYVTKPIEWNALKARISSCLKVRDAMLHEKDLMDQTLKLNQRLKQFSFSIAHDIRNPLAHIRFLCTSVREKIMSSKEGIDQIDELAEKMHQFMDSILEHSAYGTQEEISSIDLNVVAQNVLTFLAGRIEEEKAEVQVEKLPKVKGTYGLFFQLLMNVVGNAIKYHHKGQKPQVRVYSEEREEQIVVKITDNGVGMSEEDLEMVSNPLVRGKSSEGTEGSGLGLSLAKNIVTEFKGSLELHSKQGEGTTVELIFPKDQ